MSDHQYQFNLSIGFPSAEHHEVFDLIEDLDYEEEDLDTPAKLDKVLEREVEEWSYPHIEAWTEKR